MLKPSEAAMRASREALLEGHWKTPPGKKYNKPEEIRDDYIKWGAKIIDEEFAPELKKEFDRGFQQGAKHASEI